MHHNTSHIREVFLYIIFDLVRDEMSLANSLLSVNEDMELDDTVKSTLACDTKIHILYISIRRYRSADTILEFSILDLIEEFTHRRPTDMIDIVTHEQGCYKSRVVSC